MAVQYLKTSQTTKVVFVNGTQSWSSSGTDPNQVSAARYFMACSGTGTPGGYVNATFDSGLSAGDVVLLWVFYDSVNNRMRDQTFKVYDANNNLLGAVVANAQDGAFDELTDSTGAASGTITWFCLGEYTIPTGTTSIRIYCDNAGADATKFCIIDGFRCQLKTDSYTPVYAPRVTRSGACNLTDRLCWATGDKPPPTSNWAFKKQSPITGIVDADATWGSSGVNGTAAITVTLGSTLEIAAGKKLTHCGDIVDADTRTTRQAGRNFIKLNAGSIIENDSSGSASPTTTYYVVRPLTNALINNWITSTGTLGNEAIIQSKSGSTNGFLSLGGFLGGSAGGLGMINATYTIFRRLGNALSAGNYALSASMYRNTESVTLTNCTFDGCYGGSGGGATLAGISIIAAGPSVSITGTKWVNSAAGIPNLTISPTALPTAVTVQRCVFDGPFWPLLGAHFAAADFKYNLYKHQVWYGGNSASPPASSPGVGKDDGHTFFQRAANEGTPSYVIAGNPSNCLFISNKNDVLPSVPGNPHFIGNSGAIAITNSVFFYIGGAGVDVGDIIDCTGSSAANSIRNCIVLPSSGSTRSSGAVWRLGAGTSTLTIEHNTIYCSDTTLGGIQLGHTEAGYSANVVPYVRSNILWSSGSNVDFGINYDHATETGLDYVSPGGILNNCFSQLGTGTNNIVNGVAGQSILGMAGLRLSTAPAAQVNANPNFVAPTRNPLTYASAVLGLSGTSDQLCDGLISAITSDPTLSKLAVLPYIQAGFAPTNAALHGTAHDLDDIGAVAWQAAASFNAAYISRQSAIGTGVY